MKEKINLLSKGIFEYGCPDIHVSETKICLEVEAGSSSSGEFHVYSTNGTPVRAKIFSSNKQMHCEETDIIGTDNIIHFTFQTENAEPGDKAEGTISIISNGGELQVPYQAVVRSPYCQSSLGEVGNLEEFALLASEQWQEAVKLFRSQDFPRVFLVNKIHAHIYEKLIKSRNVNQAMEEFLYTLKKKEKVTFSVTQREIIHNNLTEALSDKLVLEKNTWGYQEIYIHVEGDFLSVYKKRLTSQDFLGSYYELEYFINPEFLKRGHNYGRIVLSTFSQTIEIKVSCHQAVFRDEEELRQSIRTSVYHIRKNYLEWKAGRMENDVWARETREDVDCCRNNSDDIRYALLEAHFLMTIGEENSARDIAGEINVRELRRKSLLEYGYYLYITSLYRREPDYTHYVINRLWEFYEGQCDRWEILWMLLQLDERLAGGGIQTFKRMKVEFEKGCSSPVLYQEALGLANTDPSVIRELDGFEIQLLNWGTRHECLELPLIYQFADLAVREKSYHPLVLRSVMHLSEIHGNKELLAAVCSTLIKGHKTEKIYNSWYLKGILQSLKLTQLYEYYMMSLDEASVRELPTAVLYFFNYNNQLDWPKKAFLYRYIISRKQSLERIYYSYDNIMKAFAYEQLSLGNIDSNLAYLYKYYMTKDKINAKLAGELPAVMFKYKITCHHLGIANVIVTMREVNREFIYPVNGETAYVDIFMDEYNIAFEDVEGRRYMRTVDYSMDKLMDETEFIKECYEMNPDNARILMNRSERALKYQMIDDTSIEIFKRTLRIRSIHNEYRKNILKNLIDIYYENYEGETLEKYLIRLDIRLLGSEERGSIIEYYIQRGFYEKAYEAISEYGYEDIRDKRLMRLCSRMIRKRNYEADELLLEIAFSAFKAGKYDEVILEYLNRYYLGTTKDYLDIWKAAGGFEVEAHQLEEKMLCQVLFTEHMVEESGPVFDSYYKVHPNIKIVRAYLVYSAYSYLMKNFQMKESLFRCMEIEMDQMGRGRDVCSLAMLKYFSGNPSEEDDYSGWVYREAGRFMNRGIVLPWFRAFMNLTDIPQELTERVFAVYKTSPAHTVKIRFSIRSEGNKGGWQEETMQNVCGGIFVKSWLLFAGETLVWQAMDDDGEDIVVTEKSELRPETEGEGPLVSGMDYLNRMILQKEFSDYDAFCRTACEYSRRKAIAETALDIL
ncbi:DUF5717 family protein [Frisingicoccus sp.]|uniref:DUF5717 family protein n=1 Tax=Frisingicoccus sp. TaxID=1918627 RepID=UPI002E78F89A|nr:DUF5717 family protein [Frisingicoccus sp.]MEE0751935.1 DUF5717 family protein [Frisingicoccus sp.]